MEPPTSLAPGDIPLFEAASACQLQRVVAIQIVYQHQRFVDSNGSAGSRVDSVLPGTFIRALADVTSSDTKQYVVAQVEGLVAGEPYSGFSSNPAFSSQWYFRLRLPHRLPSLLYPAPDEGNEEEEGGEEGGGCIDYDLTSISNSRMTQEEFAKWLYAVRHGIYPGEVPTLPLLEFTLSRISPFLRLRGSSTATPLVVPIAGANHMAVGATSSPLPTCRDVPQKPPSPQEQEFASSSNNASPLQPVEPPPPPSHLLAQQPSGHTAPAITTTTTSGDGEEENSPTSRRMAQMEVMLRRECMQQLSEQGAVFPRVFTHTKPSKLRLIERDLVDYLQVVRDTIVENQETCVICFSNVPTVILYPCKHRVICRACAVGGIHDVCPVCRSVFQDMFEVEEV